MISRDWRSLDASWIPASCMQSEPDWVYIDLPAPVVRPTGGVLGQARHRAATYRPIHEWPTALSLGPSEDDLLTVLSAWVLDYRTNDFAALHTDRPDSLFTALLALDDQSEPIVVCPEFKSLTDYDLRELAAVHPFPFGEAVELSQSACLLLRGAVIPHYRPPVVRPCRVLSVSLGLAP